jgi:hypothetical protein
VVYSIFASFATKIAACPLCGTETTTGFVAAGCPSPQDNISTDVFHRFFDNSVDAENASPSDTHVSATAALLPAFRSISIQFAVVLKLLVAPQFIVYWKQQDLLPANISI